MPLRISRMSALLVGIALPCIETWRRWGRISDWPFWLDDFLAAMLLLYAWHAGRKRVIDSRPYLMAGWGYTLGIAYMSFFGQITSNAVGDPSGMPLSLVVGFKAFGLAFAAFCLSLTWTYNRDSRR